MTYDVNADAIRVVQVAPSVGGADGVPYNPSRLEGSGDIRLVTPGAGALPGGVTKGISFAGAGTLTVTTEAGQSVLIPSGALAVGQIHPIRVTHITAASATGIVAYH